MMGMSILYLLLAIGFLYTTIKSIIMSVKMKFYMKKTVELQARLEVVEQICGKN
jgi:hypothetical protein